MTGRIILLAGLDTEDRTTVARVIAGENQWPLLDVTDLAGPLLRATLVHSPAEAARLEAVLACMWAQVDAGIPGVVVSAPLVTQLHTEDWLNELNYDLALRGYEATVVYVLDPTDTDPDLDPEHFMLDKPADIDALFTSAASIAFELRG